MARDKSLYTFYASLINEQFYENIVGFLSMNFSKYILPILNFLIEFKRGWYIYRNFKVLRFNNESHLNAYQTRYVMIQTQ